MTTLTVIPAKAGIQNFLIREVGYL